jgi:hypothetical protein
MMLCGGLVKLFLLIEIRTIIEFNGMKINNLKKLFLFYIVFFYFFFVKYIYLNKNIGNSFKFNC